MGTIKPCTPVCARQVRQTRPRVFLPPAVSGVVIVVVFVLFVLLRPSAQVVWKVVGRWKEDIPPLAVIPLIRGRYVVSDLGVVCRKPKAVFQRRCCDEEGYSFILGPKPISSFSNFTK